MSLSHLARTTLVAGALVAGSLGVVPSASAAPGENFGWSHRDDVRGGTGSTVTHAGSDLWATSFSNQVTLIDQGATGGGIEFLPPKGQTLQAGVTYPIGGAYRQPTATAGQVLTSSGGRFCGRNAEELGSPVAASTEPAAGWFHVAQIEFSGDELVAFSATYEVSCQYVDGPLGFEGSVAYAATAAPAPIPTAPATPGAVSGLKVTNTQPDTAGNSATTLDWTNPAGTADVTVDAVQLSVEDSVPALVGGHLTRFWRGEGARYRDPEVPFMDGRLYRVVPRGATGRIGSPAFVRVLGSRIDLVTQRDVLQIGETTAFTGRLTKSSDLATEDPMSGPPLAGRVLFLCQQYVGSVVHSCNPVARTVTDADGRFTLTTRPLANSWYSVMLPSVPGMVGNRSHLLLSAGVSPQTDLALRAGRSRAVPTVRRGSVVTFTTSRDRRGSQGVVRLQRLVDGKWRTVLTRKLGTGTGRLVIRFAQSRKGLQSYRVVKPGDSRHVTGYSPVRKVRVR